MNPRNWKSFAHTMGTSVEIFMSDYVQVPNDEDEDQGMKKMSCTNIRLVWRAKKSKRTE